MILVYSKPNCPYCVKAKNWLETNGFEYETIDISADPTERNFIIDSGFKTVPQIFVRDGYGGKRLLVEGGFTGLTALTTDELRKKLGEAA